MHQMYSLRLCGNCFLGTMYFTLFSHGSYMKRASSLVATGSILLVQQQLLLREKAVQGRFCSNRIKKKSYL